MRTVTVIQSALVTYVTISKVKMSTKVNPHISSKTMSAKHSLVGTEIIRYLDDSREFIWDVKHDSFAVATHTQSLHTLLHCRGEAMFQNLPEVADMANLLVTVEMVCSEALCRREVEDM